MATFIIRGKNHIAISPTELIEIRKKYPYCVLDVGAGDGKGTWRYARLHADQLVIALDASHDALINTAQKASRKFERGGATNLICLQGNIRESSDALREFADELRVILPWGDLLEGIAKINEPILRSLAMTCKENAQFSFVINAEIWKNNLPKHLSHLGEITPEFFKSHKDEFLRFGFEIENTHTMNRGEIQMLDTTWSAKLMSSRQDADFIMARGVVKKNDHLIHEKIENDRVDDSVDLA